MLELFNNQFPLLIRQFLSEDRSNSFKNGTKNTKDADNKLYYSKQRKQQKDTTAGTFHRQFVNEPDNNIPSKTAKKTNASPKDSNKPHHIKSPR